MCLYPEMPLVFGRVHLGVACAGGVLGGAGRGNEGGIHGGSGLEQQPLGREHGVDGGHDLQGQVVGLQEMTESEDGALIRQSADPGIKPRKLAVQGRVVQGLFHGRIRQGEPLLHEMDAQQRLHGKGRTARLATKPTARGDLRQRESCSPTVRCSARAPRIPCVPVAEAV
jgi:hypothetical protein